LFHNSEHTDFKLTHNLIKSIAEESEKRFHAIMDKLFFPPTSTSLNAGGLSRGRNSKALALVESKTKATAISDATTCKPWNRDKLLKRLATFKSMRWFAKPQAVGRA
ncbi:C3HC zinc finger-like protein, partial [Tanacetum coccineum]